MPGEGNAYKVLKRDMASCGGLAFRLRNLADGGYPDYVLVHRALPIAFAELKGVKRPTHRVELSSRQCLKFSALIVCDAPCYLLAWCIELRMWAVLPGAEYRGPLAWQAIPVKQQAIAPQDFKQGRGNIVRLGDFRTPRPAK